MDGMSQRAIARSESIGRDTVRKYLSEYMELKNELLEMKPDTNRREIIATFIEEPKYDSSNRKPTKLTADIIQAVEGYLDINRKKRAAGRHKQVLTKLDIHEELLDQGYCIGYSTINRLINRLEDKHKEAFIRQEYMPGEICEFDWGEVKLDIGGEGFKAYQMAVFTPAKSNYRFAMLFKAQDTPAFQEAHAVFFDHCGGSYKTMVYDNMRVAVKRFVGINEKEPTKALLELSVYYGMNFRFCNIASGNEKGHVERSVEFVRRKAFKITEKFDTLADANHYLLEACFKMNSRPISDGRIPIDEFDEERKHLNPRLPLFESCITKEYRVDKYSTVVINQNHYSVPDNLVGQMLLAKIYTSKIHLYYDKAIMATHDRSYKLHTWTIDLKHYLKTLYKKPGALTNSTAMLQADTKIKNIYECYYNKDAKIFLEVLEIIYEKGVDAVDAALKRLEQISPLDMSSDKVRSICDHTKEQEAGKVSFYTDELSLKSKQTLSQYNQLGEISTIDKHKEAV